MGELSALRSRLRAGRIGLGFRPNLNHGAPSESISTRYSLTAFSSALITAAVQAWTVSIISFAKISPRDHIQ